MNDPADLSHLADIVLPLPVPWWPPAPGWWILGAAFVAGTGILVASAIRRYRRDAYRKTALAELAVLETAASPADAAAVSAVLKRAALVAYPRSEVASLTGPAWLAFLDRTAPTADFTGGAAASLASCAKGDAVKDADTVAAARRWVRRHRGRG